jgi:hypothetical protein
MRKVYLHIGTEKTGTTAFQRNLQNNVANLELNNIKLYTEPGRKNIRRIPFAFQNENLVDDYIMEYILPLNYSIKLEKKRVRNELQDTFNTFSCYDFLISGEHFHSRLVSKENVNELCKFLRQFFDKIHIIVVFRNPKELAPAYYSTLLKKGYYLTVDDFICQKVNKEYFDISHIHNIWSANTDIMDIYWFDDVKKDIKKLCDSLNLPHADLNFDTHRDNKSLGYWGMKLLLIINRYFPVYTQSNSFYNPYLIRKLRAFIIKASTYFENEHKVKIDSTQLKVFENIYENSARKSAE